MTTAQAATRLGVDASTVGKMIRRGLVTGLRPSGRLKLAATKRFPEGVVRRWTWDITPQEVRLFAAARKRLGL